MGFSVASLTGNTRIVYSSLGASLFVLSYVLIQIWLVRTEWRGLADLSPQTAHPPSCVQDPRNWEGKTSQQTEKSVIEDIEAECALMDPETIAACEIPRNIHIVWYTGSGFRFDHYLALKSMFVTIKPDNVFVHGQDFPVNNEYFDKSVKEFGLQLLKSRNVHKVHDRSVNVMEHKTDVVRIETLIRFGGMYFDTDVLLLRPIFDAYKSEETVFGPQNKDGLNSGIIFAKRCSRFMRRWYQSYENLNDRVWAWQAINAPYRLMKQDNTGVKSDGDRIKTDYPASGNMLFSTDTSPDFWGKASIIHTFIRGHEKFKVSEEETRLLQNNYGHISRNILNGFPGLHTELPTDPSASASV
jgi:hypothetical protein